MCYWENCECNFPSWPIATGAADAGANPQFSSLQSVWILLVCNEGCLKVTCKARKVPFPEGWHRRSTRGERRKHLPLKGFFYFFQSVVTLKRITTEFFGSLRAHPSWMLAFLLFLPVGQVGWKFGLEAKQLKHSTGHLMIGLSNISNWPTVRQSIYFNVPYKWYTAIN